MHNCSICKCLTCELIATCSYHDLCRAENGQTKEYVKDCADYKYSEKRAKQFNKVV